MRKLLLVCAGTALLVASASASTMTGTYYVLSPDNPDVQHGIDGGTVTGLIESTLGPNGLPVASAYGQTYAGPSGPITDIDSTTHELLWWSVSAFTTLQTVQVDTLPLNKQIFPDGVSNGPDGYSAVHWNGIFYLPSATDVTFNLSSDDDGFIFVDGNLQVDNGGIHSLASVPSQTVMVGAGTHTLDLFFADRHTVESRVQFSTNVDVSGTPEPASLALGGVGLLLIAAGSLRRKITK